MKILCWNIRGIGGVSKMGVIKEMIQKNKILFLGLVETKSTKGSENWVRRIWGPFEFDWAEVKAVNGGGGLLCIWDKEFLAKSDILMGDRWICIKGYVKEVDMWCAIGLVYGPHTISERRIVWQELKVVREKFEVPLLLMGDFNEILKVGERLGNTSVTRSMSEFAEWVHDLNLTDLPIIGRKFTWRRGKSASKLDRVFVEPVWGAKYPNMKLWGLKCSKSDHIPLLLDSVECDWGPKPFRSLDMWFSHPCFKKMVQAEWQCLGTLGISQKLKQIQTPLKKWNKEVFGIINNKIKTFEEEVTCVDMQIEEMGVRDELLARRLALGSQLELWYNRKNDFWKQFARDKYAKNMDRNTKYFHSIATFKKRKKQLLELKINGRSIKEPRRIKIEARRFFKELYHQKSLPIIKIQEGLVQKIQYQDAVKLETIPTVEEVKEAVYSCDPAKAPGPDGYNLNFIRRMWDVIGSDFVNSVLNFFISGSFDKSINLTWVTLIPKTDGAEEMKDFRPISMVGCIYKVIAKILARRIRG